MVYLYIHLLVDIWIVLTFMYKSLCANMFLLIWTDICPVQIISGPVQIIIWLDLIGTYLTFKKQWLHPFTHDQQTASTSELHVLVHMWCGQPADI